MDALAISAITMHSGIFAGAISGLVLTVSGLAKLPNYRAFSEVVKAYQLVPHSWVKPLAFGLPWLEVGVGLSLTSRILVSITGALAALAFLLFASAITINLLRGRRDIRCGCFGTSSNRRLGWTLVTRNLVLACFALVGGNAAFLSTAPQQMALRDVVLTTLMAAAVLAAWWLSQVLVHLVRLPNPMAYPRRNTGSLASAHNQTVKSLSHAEAHVRNDS